MPSLPICSELPSEQIRFIDPTHIQQNELLRNKLLLATPSSSSTPENS